jgi:hypothetical protein
LAINKDVWVFKVDIVVAAKGVCDWGLFFAALVEDHLVENDDVAIHIAHDQVFPLDATSLPSNIFLHQCENNASILQLWGVAIAKSESHYIAVLDIKCPPEKGWKDRVLSEIDNKTELFCGDVEPGWDLIDKRIVGYLIEYSQFKKPTPVNLNEVPGNNIVFKRALLADKVDVSRQGFFKTFMVWRAEKELGIKVRKFNDMAVCYYKSFTYKHYMYRRYVHGRCFAASRFDSQGQPPRLICFLFVFLLPFLRIWRIFKGVKRDPELRKSFFRFFHLIVQSEVAWSFGEMVGYAVGGRQYCELLD